MRPVATTATTPTQITTLGLVIGCVAASLYAWGGAAAHVGAACFVLAFWLDHADGELARMTARTSTFGHYYDVVAGGAVLIEMLHLLEPIKLGELGFHSADQIHVMVEAMRRGFADRAELFGDSDFVAVPTAGVIARAYAEKRSPPIDLRQATPSEKVRAGEKKPDPATPPGNTPGPIAPVKGQAPMRLHEPVSGPLAPVKGTTERGSR